ncbi:MAG: hypothetical protein D6675_14845 [Gemmatimonadetes bacterium]|nr:MAG: hypothetical protein D6675_14845 [Gemmatimonadota bacterium]
MKSILIDHLRRYPAMHVQDLYKLCHQAALGNEHLLADPDHLLDYLDQELSRLAPDETQPLLEPISPTGLVRVHLRPFKAKKGDPQRLLTAMQRTAQTFHPSVSHLQEYWQLALDLDHVDPPLMRHFFEARRAEDFPAVHHSEVYRAAYSPAYRVVLKREFVF